MKGTEFLKYINPVLIALQANGGAEDTSELRRKSLGITIIMGEM